MMAAATLGRIIGLGLDGVSPETLKPTVVEAVIVCIMLLAHKRFGTA